QLRTQEEQRVQAQLEEAAMNKLVEISSIEYPPQMVDHEAQHLMESFTRNVEQQGLKLPQYLRLIGKEQDAFELEIRTEPDTRGKRAGALEACATAEQIDVAQQEVGAEVQQAAASTDEPAAVEQLALANESTRQRIQEVTRERKAMARLLEMAA